MGEEDDLAEPAGRPRPDSSDADTVSRGIDDGGLAMEKAAWAKTPGDVPEVAVMEQKV
jgi:hypothetical protein